MTRSGIYLALAGLFALSIAARLNLVVNRPLAGYMDNEDAASHVLATAIAYRQVPWTVHRFLPIFTLAGRHNQGINDLPGSSVRDKAGNCYYTSFPPGAFIVAYVATWGGDLPSIVRLRLFNILLQLLGAIGIGMLAYRLIGPNEDNGRRILASACAATFYICAPECLKSHTIGYWAHQVYAPIFIAQIYLFLFRPNSRCLPLLCGLSGLLEWTAYLVNAALAGLALLQWWRTRLRNPLKVGLSIGLATCVAGLLLLGWYSGVTTIPEYVAALRYRSGVRTSGIVGLCILGMLYAVSLGPFLAPLATSLFRWRMFRRRTEPDQTRCWLGITAWRAVFIICGAALLENLLLISHANQYSFDRLKGIQFAALLTAWAVSRSAHGAPQAFRLSLAAGMLSILMFWFSYDVAQDYRSLEYAVHQRLGRIIRDSAPADVPAFTNTTVRGHTLYYAGRNIAEGITGTGELSNAAVYEVKEEWVYVTVRRDGSPEHSAYALGRTGRRDSTLWELSLALCNKIDAATIRQTLRKTPVALGFAVSEGRWCRRLLLMVGIVE